MRLKAIVFDWAGTVVDFGCLCPVQALELAFRAHGMEVSAPAIQQFMGIAKREHVRKVLALPEVLAQWQARHRGAPGEQAIDAVYEIAERKMLETVADSATPVPYLEEALAVVRKRGLKIGSATGYTTPLMERLVPAAARQGFRPEFWIASDQVPQGRPWPWMIFRNMEKLGVYPPSAVVKVGDTVVDVQEARNAGVWSIGVVESSSLMGKSREELKLLSGKERDAALNEVRSKLSEAGADLVIENLSELEGALDELERRLGNGLLPAGVAALEA